MTLTEHMIPHHAHGYCLCVCTECATFDLTGPEGATSECHCPGGCACHRPAKPLPAAYYANEVQSVPEHKCSKCGTEVFRKGTRGRFPKYCPPCKEKQ